jgi:hypothetical protein
MMDDVEIQTHSNETLGMARRCVLRRIKAGAAQHVKLDLYFNGDLLDPSEDRKLLSEISFAEKMVIIFHLFCSLCC